VVLLDSYEGERHPVGATVLQMTDAFNRMMVGHSRPLRLLQRLVISSVLRLRRPRLAVGGRLTGLGIAYPSREPGRHPWAGRRMPDVRCTDGRLYELLRGGRFVLVRATNTAADEQWSDHVLSAYWASAGVQGLPTTVLVRPDGYIAWAADDPTHADVETALVRWCGPAAFAWLILSAWLRTVPRTVRIGLLVLGTLPFAAVGWVAVVPILLVIVATPLGRHAVR
jgi:hypothetical protein